MSDHDMNVQQFAWRAPLICLTQIGCPEIGDGQPTIAFINPELISHIAKSIGAFPKWGGKDEKFDPVQCTQIILSTGYSMHVTEDPELVAMLRDKALGHPPSLKALP